jgi:hypothetical protein
MIKRIPLHFVLMMVSVLLSGCASLQLADLFQGYNSQMKPVKAAQRNGDFVKAKSLLNNRSASNNSYVLSLLEKGRLEFLANDWPASQQSLNLAYQQVKIAQDKAKIQISKGVEKLGAVVSNDNALSYGVSYYEQGMLHTYQALNYLYQNDLEGALVEVRRANLVQENALKAYENELYQANDDLLDAGMSAQSLSSSYPDMEATIGKIKNGFQNAYTFYLSGVLFEAAGEPNDAYIDYKRALQIYPDNHYLQQDVLRLASKLGMGDDLRRFEQRFGKYQASTTINQGQVVVLVEQDIVNSKQDVGLNLPIQRGNGDLKFFSFSLPVYRGSLAQHNKINIMVNDENFQSNEIVKIQSLAAKDLQEQLPGLVTRQVVRLVAKEQMRQKLSREAGDVGNILASLYNIASEKADTRSWATLPDEVDIMRMNLPAGKQQLQVSVNGKAQMIEVNVNPNRITLINFTRIGNYTGYQTVNL